MKQLLSCLLGLVILLGFRCNLLAAAKESWWEVRSPHFVAYGNVSSSDIKEVLAQFEGIREVFLRAFPSILVDTPRPIVLVVLRDKSSMKRFLPLEGSQDPSRYGGFFLSGRDKHYAVVRQDSMEESEQPYHIVFHEYTHGILHRNFPGMPLWLDEGLADFYGATQIQRNQVLIGKVPHFRLHTVRKSEVFPLETILEAHGRSHCYVDTVKSEIFYAQCWALTHFLLVDEKARKDGLFFRYLQALGTMNSLSAARSAFGDLKAFQNVLNSYIHQSRYHYISYKLAVRITDDEYTVRALEEAENLAIEAEYNIANRKLSEGKALLDRASTLSPRSARVLAGLGYYFFITSEYEAAWNALQEAQKLGLQDFRITYYLAMIASRRGTESSKVLEWLELANRLQPNHPEVLMSMCHAFAMNSQDKAKALDLGKRAVELEPHNLGLWTNLGIVCMNLQMAPEAQAIGERIKQIAANLQEQELEQRYRQLLSQFLSQVPVKDKRSTTESHESLDSSSPPVSTVKPPKRLKFTLPEHLTTLGQEVVKLHFSGKHAEAVRLVEEALSKSKKAEDRKALEKLLDTLRQAHFDDR